MPKRSSRILVPTDFSIVAESAMQHALIIAHKSSATITLLHVINRDSRAELKKRKTGPESLDAKLGEQCRFYASQYDVPFDYIIREGSIFTTIGQVADEINASLMVMGTHGVLGMQHILGAFALKVVSSSKVPVIVVQSKLPQNEAYLTIVSPIDASLETRQKTLQTIAIAVVFSARVFLFRQKTNDPAMADRIELNTKFVLKYLNEHQLQAEVVEQEKASSDFAKDFIAFSKQVNADLIVILTTTEKGIKDRILGPVEQEVINNKEQIPVMCVNSLQHIFSVSSSKT